jgi:hypothetical protein
VTHTTLPPKHKPVSGVALKPYLGRLYYVSQLNSALLTVARQEGLQVVDYEQVRARRGRGIWRRLQGGCACNHWPPVGMAFLCDSPRVFLLPIPTLADWSALHGEPDLPRRPHSPGARGGVGNRKCVLESSGASRYPQALKHGQCEVNVLPCGIIANDPVTHGVHVTNIAMRYHHKQLCNSQYTSSVGFQGALGLNLILGSRGWGEERRGEREWGRTACMHAHRRATTCVALHGATCDPCTTPRTQVNASTQDSHTQPHVNYHARTEIRDMFDLAALKPAGSR